MKAVVYTADNVLEYKDVPDVSPKAGEVKIQVKATGICGSDIHGYQGISGRRIAPMIMGHEFAGIISEVGEGVQNFQVGDRVSVYPVDFCGECEMCKAENYPLCKHKRQFGVLDVDGAFAQYICVPEKCCFRLTDNTPYTIGSMMEPLAVGYRAVQKAGALQGKTVFISGTGTIGLMAIASAALQHPAKIIVADLVDSRLEYAKKMGAIVVVNPGKEDLDAVIQRETDGKGVDVALEAVGIGATINQTISALGQGGTAVWIGMNRPSADIDIMSVVTKELTVIGSFLYGYREFGEVVDLVNQGKLDLSPMISREEPLEKCPEMFHLLATNPGDNIKIIIVQE